MTRDQEGLLFLFPEGEKDVRVHTLRVELEPHDSDAEGTADAEGRSGEMGGDGVRQDEER